MQALFFAVSFRLMSGLLPFQTVDPCTLYESFETLLQQVAVGGALLAVLYLGSMKIISFINPQFESRVRQVPSNIIIGFAAIAMGPWLVTQLASAFSIGAC